MHLVLGQLKLSRAHVLIGEELYLFEAYDLRPDEHIAMRASRGTSDGLFFGDFEDANLGVADRVGEVIHVNWFHIGLALIKIQMLNVVLLSLVDVDRFRMDGRERRREIDFPDHLRLASI